MFTDYGRILNRDRSDLSAARSESNYSIYSINGGFEGRPRGISELGCLVSTPWTHKSFIDKRRLTSQAGRRGSSPSPAPCFQQAARNGRRFGAPGHGRLGINVIR